MIELQYVTDERGTRSIRIGLNSAGDLEIRGQDLGRIVRDVFAGFSEYEWVRTVKKDDLPTLRALLGAEDVLGALKEKFSGDAADRLGEFLETNRIKTSLWNWHGE